MALEEQLGIVDRALGESEVWTDPERLASLQAERVDLQEKLAPLTVEWERRASDM